MMKKAMMAFAAAVMMSATVVAQSNNQPQMPQRPEMDKAEMAKMRTEQMVKDYALSEEQAGQLLALNTEFADKMPMMMGRGPRGGMQRPDGEARPQNGEGRPHRSDTTRQARQRRPMGERPSFDREAMRKAMDDYNEGLKKILTEDQFKKYEDDMNKRRQQMRRAPRGMMRQQMPQPAQ